MRVGSTVSRAPSMPLDAVQERWPEGQEKRQETAPQAIPRRLLRQETGPRRPFNTNPSAQDRRPRSIREAHAPASSLHDVTWS